MRIGITLLSTSRSLAPAELAREVEARGFDSLWFAEHSHIPASRLTPFPGASPKRPELPDVYWHLNGQTASMAMAAAVTTDLTIGPSYTTYWSTDSFDLKPGGNGKAEAGLTYKPRWWKKAEFFAGYTATHEYKKRSDRDWFNDQLEFSFKLNW